MVSPQNGDTRGGPPPPPPSATPLYQRQRHPDMEKHILTFVRGSGSVRVHLSTILRVQVWFRFTKVKFCWFRFGLGAPKWNGLFGFTVRVQVRFDTLVTLSLLIRHIIKVLLRETNTWIQCQNLSAFYIRQSLLRSRRDEFSSRLEIFVMF